MTTYNPTITFDSSSDANFRAWVTGLSSAIKTVGLIQMGDSGQIDKTTVLAPVSTNSSRGYEIYQLSRYADTFFRADQQITAGSASSNGGTYIVQGANPLPYIVGGTMQAAASPTTASLAGFLFDPGSTAQSIDFDVVSVAADAGGGKYFNVQLRYTDSNNKIIAQFIKTGGNWTWSVTTYISGVSTVRGSGDFGLTTDPTHLRVTIDATGNVTLIHSVGANQVYSNVTATCNITASPNGLLTGTKIGTTIASTSQIDNVCIAEAQPLYIKMEYGSLNSVGAPGIGVTVAQSTNGAGTTNSALAVTRQYNGYSTANPGAEVCYFSGDGSYLNYYINFASHPFFFSVERSRDASGAVTNEGALFCYRAGTSGGADSYNETVLNYLTQSTSQATSSTTGVFLFQGCNHITASGFLTGSDGSNVYYFPQQFTLPKICYSLALMSAFSADVTNFGSFSTTNCGATHTYLTLANAGGAMAGVVNTVLNMRYE